MTASVNEVAVVALVVRSKSGVGVPNPSSSCALRKCLLALRLSLDPIWFFIDCEQVPKKKNEFY